MLIKIRKYVSYSFLFFTPISLEQTGFQNLSKVTRHDINSRSYFEVICLDGKSESVQLFDLKFESFCGGSSNQFIDASMGTVLKKLPGRLTLSRLVRLGDEVCTSQFGSEYRLANELEIAEAINRGLLDPNINQSFGYPLSKESVVWTSSYKVIRTNVSVLVSMLSFNMTGNGSSKTQTYNINNSDMGAVLCVK